MGLTVSTAEALFAAGVDVITSGNHIWDKREIYPFLDTSDRVLRPLNYGTHDVPGRGWGTYEALDGSEIAVINLQGRTYMQQIDNPFTDADRLLDEASEPLPPIRLVDFHCELTSEKNALGLYLDGRVSVVVGTHTHIVTGDERILPKGTAYQTDLGMTGPVWSVIGFKPEHRPAALRQRAADAVRGRRGAGRPQRLPGRHRPRDRPRAADRADPAPRRGLRWRRPGPRATPRVPTTTSRSSPATRSPTSTPTRPAPTASSSPPSSSARRTRRASGLFALADHDNLAGYRELVAPGAAPLPADLTLVPAVEINAVTRGLGLDLFEGELHVLGIGVDPANEAFEAALAGQRGARRTRFRATVERLREIGMPIDAQVASAATSPRDDALGRPTIARALVAAGLRRERRGCVQAAHLATASRATCRARASAPVEAIRAIRAAGGLASLAHFWRGARPHLAPARPHRRGPERAREPPPLVRRGDARQGGGDGPGARPRRDRRDRLPRRPRARMPRPMPAS